MGSYGGRALVGCIESNGDPPRPGVERGQGGHHWEGCWGCRGPPSIRGYGCVYLSWKRLSLVAWPGHRIVVLSLVPEVLRLTLSSRLNGWLRLCSRQHVVFTVGYDVRHGIAE